MIVWLFEIDRTKPRAPPWARLLQDESDFEKRRVVEERRRGIYRMSTQVRTKTKTRCSPEHLSPAIVAAPQGVEASLQVTSQIAQVSTLS